ncbi:Vacuolar amino acid transporter 2 [Diplonema papillatum]|nr:Vacuolar amino acid transporter 2 [Diplonema papillatum]
MTVATAGYVQPMHRGSPKASPKALFCPPSSAVSPVPIDQMTDVDLNGSAAPGPADALSDASMSDYRVVVGLSDIDPAIKNPGPEAAHWNDGPGGYYSSKKMDPAPGRHSSLSAFFNFVNSIVGAGIVGLSYGLRETGFVAGLFLFVLTAYLTDYSIRLQIRLGCATGYTSYEELMMSTLGKKGRRIINVALFCLSFGGMIAYLVIIADTVPPVLTKWFGATVFQDRSLCLVVTTAGLCLPLGLLRDIGKLGKVSGLSCLAVLLLIFMIIIRLPATMKIYDDAWIESQGHPIPEDRAAAEEAGYTPRIQFGDGWTILNPRVMHGLGVIMFSFVCQHASFMVYNSMREPLYWDSVTHSGVTAALGLSLALAVVGYQGFLECTRPNVLNNFAANDEVITVARALLAMSMVFTYPIEMFVARSALNSMFFDSPVGWARHIFFTLVIFSSTLGVALVLRPNSLGYVLGLTGGTCASFVAFIGPALAFFAYHKQAYPNASWFEMLRTRATIMPIVLLVVGVATMLSNAVYAVADVVYGSTFRRPDWCPDTGIY